MTFLADESVDRQIVSALRAEAYTISYVPETTPGLSDSDVLDRANQMKAILLTGDKDFGEMVFRRRVTNHGIVFFRLSGLTQERKAAVAVEAFQNHAASFAGAFSVVTDRKVRVRFQS